jgi:hypothetical protein
LGNERIAIAKVDPHVGVDDVSQPLESLGLGDGLGVAFLDPGRLGKPVQGLD